jgi:hypothetical protein
MPVPTCDANDLGPRSPYTSRSCSRHALLHHPLSPPPPGIKPEQVDILITNCSIFCPTPSLASMLINKFKFRRDVEAYHLGGMGCSIGVVAIGLVRDMLKVGGPFPPPTPPLPHARAPQPAARPCLLPEKARALHGRVRWRTPAMQRASPSCRRPCRAAGRRRDPAPPFLPATPRHTPTASRCLCRAR